ncbi:tRNA uridine-5-carboxymethylaminomethyl(34) synthesis GTPase MnmE [Novosphingobium sp. 1949]|uniref:tRNA modification GTPase MnmE n=1 Tax=Novosphingobium organovorum TaxID=2930092 RepID=A0ABT0BAW5_9SPHN|nr:tRNA uridine-5-carboxymethylaminomethyl(34) synthesis GTPase MnmE [Novosphingobium organovorum]MCJ2182201.1 tRNA uridine-5-carboxymethylaminomethyl(34) synthesis GTPase MnmE [Novosphingobium organovorum]
MTDTIFALSSGAPPAALGVIRISGPAAGKALAALAGTLPTPRQASLRSLRVSRGTAQEALLDQALVLWFPGPRTATGEDLAELHLHGGRAVVRVVEAALGQLDLGEDHPIRPAEAGEFTRRAFANGRIDLAEAEGLADLLSAETELQRRAAIAMAGGAFSQQVALWRDRVLSASAAVEAILDFADEDDVAVLPELFHADLGALADDLTRWLERPRAEALREGLRVVLAGPPNAGKSTLFNALVEDEAAITAPLAGTTRDVLVRTVALGGVPFAFIDTAGLREGTADGIEAIGIDRARGELDRADLVLWLGPEGEGPVGTWEIDAQIDRGDVARKRAPLHRVSAQTGEGLDVLRDALVAFGRDRLPRPGDVAINRRQADLLGRARVALARAQGQRDPLLLAEELRVTRVAFDTLIGRTTTEDMLDALFGRFCIGK